jgi:drug/metabolite transporter (DMT)-like permease
MAQSAMPLFTLAAAILFLGEKVTWSLILGTGLVLGGIYLIIEPGRRRRHLQTNLPPEKRRMGVSLVICASLLWAISISLLKLGLQGVSLILANGVRLPLAALVLLLLILWQKSPPQPTTPKFKDVALGAITGLLGFGLGGILFLQAILYAGAAKTTVLTTSAPLFGLPLSLIFLKERITGRVVAGMVLGVLGIGFIV